MIYNYRGKKVIIPAEFYSKHKKCPDCGNDNVRRNIVQIKFDEKQDYNDTVSMAHCSACKWSGKIKDLK